MRRLVLALLFAPGFTLAAALEGHVALVVDGKPLRAEEAADVVVYFRPAAATAVKPPAVPYEMGTKRKQFVPRVLPVVIGSQVRFPNQDPILHNAFSTSKDNAFDVGLYGSGEEQVVTFTHAGYVRVYCNVHHSMVGHILVLDTPYFTHPGADGKFTFADLPSGRGDLRRQVHLCRSAERARRSRDLARPRDTLACAGRARRNDCRRCHA